MRRFSNCAPPPQTAADMLTYFHHTTRIQNKQTVTTVVRLPLKHPNFITLHHTSHTNVRHRLLFGFDTGYLCKATNFNSPKSRPVSSAEVKNEWSYTTTLPIRIHGVHRHNLYHFLHTQSNWVASRGDLWTCLLFHSKYKKLKKRTALVLGQLACIQNLSD